MKRMWLIAVLAASFAAAAPDENKCPQKTIKDVYYCETEKTIVGPDGELIDVKKNHLCKNCATKEFDTHVIETLTGKSKCTCDKCVHARKLIDKGSAVELVKVKACERMWWTSPKCEKCKGEKSLVKGKCCNGKGEQMEAHKDYAILVDKCDTCGKTSISGRAIEHDSKKHTVWKCMACSSEYESKGTCRKCPPKPDGTAAGGNLSELFEVKKPEKVTRFQCSKSGTFPHVSKQ